MYTSQRPQQKMPIYSDQIEGNVNYKNKHNTRQHPSKQFVQKAKTKQIRKTKNVPHNQVWKAKSPNEQNTVSYTSDGNENSNFHLNHDGAKLLEHGSKSLHERTSFSQILETENSSSAHRKGYFMHGQVEAELLNGVDNQRTVQSQYALADENRAHYEDQLQQEFNPSKTPPRRVGIPYPESQKTHTLHLHNSRFVSRRVDPKHPPSHFFEKQQQRPRRNVQTRQTPQDLHNTRFLQSQYQKQQRSRSPLSQDLDHNGNALYLPPPYPPSNLIRIGEPSTQRDRVWNEKKQQDSLTREIKKQIEDWFSDESWNVDKHLQSLVDNEGFVAVSAISQFPKFQTLCSDENQIIEACRRSTLIEIRSDNKKIRKRKNQLKEQIPEGIRKIVQGIEEKFNKQQKKKEEKLRKQMTDPNKENKKPTQKKQNGELEHTSQNETSITKQISESGSTNTTGINN